MPPPCFSLSFSLSVPPLDLRVTNTTRGDCVCIYLYSDHPVPKNVCVHLSTLTLHLIDTLSIFIPNSQLPTPNTEPSALPPPPAPLSGLKIILRLPADQTPGAVATEVVSGIKVEVQQLQLQPQDVDVDVDTNVGVSAVTKTWVIEVPTVEAVRAVFIKPQSQEDF